SGRCQARAAQRARPRFTSCARSPARRADGARPGTPRRGPLGTARGHRLLAEGSRRASRARSPRDRSRRSGRGGDGGRTIRALAARAAFLESRGRFSEARALQLRLLSRRPDSPEVLAALARLSLADGQMEVASAHVQKLRSLASSLEPGAPEDDRREVANALF